MDNAKFKRLVIGLVIIAVGVFLAASILTHNPREGPFPNYPPAGRPNLCGSAGAYVSAYALAALGWTSLAIAALIIAVGGYVVADRKPQAWGARLAGITLALVALTILLSLPHVPRAAGRNAWAVSGPSAGIVGMFLTDWLYLRLGPVGAVSVFALTGIVAAVLLMNKPVTWAWEHVRLAAADALARVRGRMHKPADKQPEIITGPVIESRPAHALKVTPLVKPGAATAPKPTAAETQAKAELQPQPVKADRPAPVQPEKKPAVQPAIEAERKPKVTPVPVRRAKAPEGDTFKLPQLDILDPIRTDGQQEDEKDILQKGKTLEQTLREFKIEAQVVRVQKGPVITMYELSLAAGTKVANVEARADDLAIALTAPNVRIVAPLPGRNTIGVEVPNTHRAVVTMRELAQSMDRKTANMAMPLFLGKDTAGAPLTVDLTQAPHLLLAGATGSGKSVAINTIIASLLLTRTPREVQLLLIDPKSVEFTDYQNLPHLICPVVTDMKKTPAVLQWACKKMDERYSTLASVGVRNITEYNRLGREEIIRRINPEEGAEIDDIPFHMPYTVIIIDELAELMLVAAKDVETSIARLSQKARAVGIHIICATQRPSADVITGLIKANLPVRIAFQVPSMVDSRTILDRNGAQLLLGKGDMLMLPPGSSRMVRAQGTYMSPQETERLVDFWMAQGEPQYRAEMREFTDGAAIGEGDGDDLYEEAARIVLETQRGSVSLLQRRLSIGYSRAARLVDMMAEAGIVGAYRGSQARDVLLTLDEWAAARSQAKAG